MGDYMVRPRLGLIVCLLLATALPAVAQRRHHARHERAHVQSDTTAPEIKPDLLTLRYKPQAGTLLYDVNTTVRQHVRTDRDELFGTLTSTAQLAFHNMALDYKKGLWTFERYFTRFKVAGRNITGDSLALEENQAVNKVTQLTYNMQGIELKKVVLDSLKLFNAEAQTNAYFFQPPRMLIPLPEKAVTYGTTWEEHTLDTVHVHDTINVGVTVGSFIYDVSRVYQFVTLVDTFGGHLAVIVARDTGTFEGEQSNTVTNVHLKTHGPIGGSDTTFLDLVSGRVLIRTVRMTIPTTVEISSTSSFSDVLEVHSHVLLSQSNARDIRKE